MNNRVKVLALIIVAFLLLVGGAMLLNGLVQGDDVDREENPVRSLAA